MSDQGVHQGMILAITPYQYLTLDELLAQTKEQPLYLILDNLKIPIISAPSCEPLMPAA